MAYSVGILVFNQVEVLDFAGPYEVFTCASRVCAKYGLATANPLFEVFLIGQHVTPLRARAGLSVIPDYAFADHPSLDLLIVPGGVVSDELGNAELLHWINDTAARTTLTASVCTGVFLLAQAGLLAGKSVTTHWEDIDDLRERFPGLHIKTEQRWVDEGNIITSGGISAGIDMSLHLVERIAGRDLAERTAQQMEFDWTENA